MGGLAPIKLEVCADLVKILETGVYVFECDGRNVGYYPLASTIIQDIEDNPSYEAPPEPEGLGGDLDHIRTMLAGFNRR